MAILKSTRNYVLTFSEAEAEVLMEALMSYTGKDSSEGEIADKLVDLLDERFINP